ncbi:Nn.00g029240.m01.CDS01 [Neocucurbitaria sp. VM-36]
MPPTADLAATQYENDITAEAQQSMIPQGRSSAISACANADEDWRLLTDFEERRRIQSRIAQRQYRQRQKQAKPHEVLVEGQQTIQAEPRVTEALQDDLPTQNLSFSDLQQHSSYSFDDPSVHNASHQHCLSLGDGSLMPQQAFMPQLSSPRPPSVQVATPMSTPSLVDTGAQTQPMYSLNPVFVPETPQQQCPSLVSEYTIPSQQSTPHLTSPPPSQYAALTAHQTIHPDPLYSLVNGHIIVVLFSLMRTPITLRFRLLCTATCPPRPFIHATPVMTHSNTAYVDIPTKEKHAPA